MCEDKTVAKSASRRDATPYLFGAVHAHWEWGRQKRVMKLLQNGGRLDSALFSLQHQSVLFTRLMVGCSPLQLATL